MQVGWCLLYLVTSCTLTCVLSVEERSNEELLRDTGTCSNEQECSDQPETQKYEDHTLPRQDLKTPQDDQSQDFLTPPLDDKSESVLDKPIVYVSNNHYKVKTSVETSEEQQHMIDIIEQSQTRNSKRNERKQNVESEQNVISGKTDTNDSTKEKSKIVDKQLHNVPKKTRIDFIATGKSKDLAEKELNNFDIDKENEKIKSKQDKANQFQDKANQFKSKLQKSLTEESPNEDSIKLALLEKEMEDLLKDEPEQLAAFKYKMGLADKIAGAEMFHNSLIDNLDSLLVHPGLNPRFTAENMPIKMATNVINDMREKEKQMWKKKRQMWKKEKQNNPEIKHNPAFTGKTNLNDFSEKQNMKDKPFQSLEALIEKGLKEKIDNHFIEKRNHPDYKHHGFSLENLPSDLIPESFLREMVEEELKDNPVSKHKHAFTDKTESRDFPEDLHDIEPEPSINIPLPKRLDAKIHVQRQPEVSDEALREHLISLVRDVQNVASQSNPALRHKVESEDLHNVPEELLVLVRGKIEHKLESKNKPGFGDEDSKDLFAQLVELVVNYYQTHPTKKSSQR